MLLLPDTILDFLLIPLEIFMVVLFICDLEDWDKIKKEVENTFAAAFYITGLVLAFINLLLLIASGGLSISGSHVDSLVVDIFIILFTCFNVVSLFISEYWKR